MRTKVIFVLGAAAVAIAATGCGSSDETTPSTSAAAQATVTEVEKICKSIEDDVGDRAFPVDDFDPKQPNPSDLPAVGEYFAPAVTAHQTALESMEALTPDAEVSAEVEDLKDALSARLAVVEKQVATARASDADGFVATLDDATTSGEAISDASDALGIDLCGGE